MKIWQCLTGTQRQAALELISDTSPAAKTRLLSFNRTQSRAVTSLLTEHHTLRRRLYIMRLMDSALYRGGAEDETSAHILCECEALLQLRHT